MYDDLKQKTNSILEDEKNDMIAFLQELLRIPSIAGEPKPGMPYGEKIAEVQNIARKKANEMGFLTGSFEDKIITVDFNEKETKEGFIAHLDVVPAEAEKWTFPPYDGTVRDNIIYGRGVIDDKGPAVAALWAMHAVKKAGINLKYNVRLLLGGAEETGMRDFSDYVKKNTLPEYFFTPDGVFPIGIGERGLIKIIYNSTMTASKILSVKSGNAVNIIPESATAVIHGFSKSELIEIISGFDFDTSYEVTEVDNLLTITFTGKPAHASQPEDGINALTAMVSLLAKIEPENTLISDLHKAFPHGVYHGAGVGISGDKINISLTQLKFDGENVFYTCDGRVHETECTKDYVDIVRKNLPHDYQVDMIEPHLVDSNSRLVKTLQEIYRAETGLEPETYTMAGLTYAHYTENGVVFGGYIPGDGSGNLHAIDESYNLDTMLKMAKMTAHSIIEFCEAEIPE